MIAPFLIRRFGAVGHNGYTTVPQERTYPACDGRGKGHEWSGEVRVPLKQEVRRDETIDGYDVEAADPALGTRHLMVDGVWLVPEDERPRVREAD